jgi:hypothetical protein
MDGERVSQGPLQIGVHPPAHGHTDVGRLEGRRIIHAVTGHGHHGTAGQRR